MQLLVERQQIHVMRKVEYLLGKLVHGPPVTAVPVRVVVATILEAAVEDGRGKRVRLVAEQTSAVEAGVELGLAVVIVGGGGRECVCRCMVVMLGGRA